MDQLKFAVVPSLTAFVGRQVGLGVTAMFKLGLC